MSEGSQIILFLQCLNEICPEYSTQKTVPGILKRMFGANANDSMKRAVWFLSNPEPYAMFCHALFGSEPTDNAVEVLQKHGYYLSGTPSLMKEIESKFDVPRMRELFECMMWAYLDRRLPEEALKKIMGQTKTKACSDAESSLCMWVNTCAKKHSKLQPVSAITQHFFGLPHFRAVLYNFVQDDELLKFSDDPKVNAKVGLTKAADMGLQAPFPASQYIQPPLMIMCYLCQCVIELSELKRPRTPVVITGVDLSLMRTNVEVKKREVADLTKRVDELSQIVHDIAERLKNMKRPMSHMARPVQNPEVEERERPKTVMSAAPGEKRVSWDLPEQSEEEPEHQADEDAQNEDDEGQLTIEKDEEQDGGA